MTMSADRIPEYRACDGCNLPGPVELLWLSAPLGLCAMRVHRDRTCAEQARVARGGGRFVTFDEPDGQLPLRVQDQRLMAAVEGYAADWRRTHTGEGVAL